MSKLDELLLGIKDYFSDVGDCPRCPMKKMCDELEEENKCSEGFYICDEENNDKYLKIVKEYLKYE